MEAGWFKSGLHRGGLIGELPVVVCLSLGRGDVSDGAEQAVWRYAYDAQQRRVLAQQGESGQGVASQSETAATERSAFEGNSARLSLPGQASAYSANGQPERWGQRSYTWDALGRLSHVRQGDQELARYTYDHRGLRVGKSMGEGADQTTFHTLYSQDHSPQAELDSEGRLQRLYLWLSPQDTGLAAPLPLAVVDRDTPSALIAVEPSVWQHITQAGRDALLLVRLWASSFTANKPQPMSYWPSHFCKLFSGKVLFQSGPLPCSV